MTTQASGTTGISRNALPFLVGQVIFTAGSSAPSGFLRCNGDAVSRTTYSALFAVCGTTYGVGDGSTTFNLPDLRGEFLRGLDDGRGVDVGRVLGSAQAEEIQKHTHLINTGDGSNWVGTGRINTGYGQVNTTTNTNATGGTETRPRNIALLVCIFTGI